MKQAGPAPTWLLGILLASCGLPMFAAGLAGDDNTATPGTAVFATVAGNAAPRTEPAGVALLGAGLLGLGLMHSRRRKRPAPVRANTSRTVARSR